MRPRRDEPSAASWDWQEEEDDSAGRSDAGSCTKEPIVDGWQTAATADAMSTSISMGPSSGGLKRGALRPGHAGSPFGRAPMLAACALVVVTMLLAYQHYTHAAQRRQLGEELAFQKQKYRLLEQEKRELNIKNEAVQAEQQSVQKQKAAALERQKSAERESESLQGKVAELEAAKQKADGERTERINALVRNHSAAISELESRLQEESVQLRRDLTACRDNVTSLLEQLAGAAALQARAATGAGAAIGAVPPARSEPDLDRKPSAPPPDEAEQAPADLAGAQPDADGPNVKAAGGDSELPAAGADGRIAFASDTALGDSPPPAAQSADGAAGRQLQFVRPAKGDSDAAVSFRQTSDAADRPIVFERREQADDGQ